MRPKFETLLCLLLIAIVLFALALISTPASALEPRNHAAQGGPYTISGNAGVGETTLSYDDGGLQTATADGNGDYSFVVPSGWSGTVTPSKPGYAFTPANRYYDPLSSDQTSQDYTAAVRKQVSVGRSHSCGILPGGALYCWGDNDYGEATPPAGIFTQIGSGYLYSCGLKLDNSVACWGDDGYGAASPPAGAFTQISVGPVMTCGLRPDGTIACWGLDWDGPISNIPSGVFTQVSAGVRNACAIRPDQTPICWGNDEYGQVSDTPADPLTQISTAWDYTCGIKTDGALVCWGTEQYGLTDPPGGSFIQISAAPWHACGIKTDGMLICWGEDSDGVINPPDETFIQVSAGRNHICGVNSAQRWVCWWGEGGIPSKYTRPYSISGRTGAAYATLSYDDNGPQTATTDDIGIYSVYVSDGWSGTVTPTQPNFTFNPPSRVYSNVNANQDHQNYGFTAILTSVGSQDGWLRESQPGSGKGSLANATSKAIILGDDTANRQYRAVLSFDTRQLAIPFIKVKSAVLKLYRNGRLGNDPFKVLGKLFVDVPFINFGKNAALKPEDFSAPAWAKKVGGNVTLDGIWYSIPLNATGRDKLVELFNFAQFRLYFSLPSNLNGAANQINFFSGNGPEAFRPQLVITYVPPP